MNYIAEKLKAEVERLGEMEYLYSYDQCVGFYDALDRMETFINSFLKEQPEVDIEKEYKEYVEDDPVFSILTNRNVGLAIAHHFYELGLNGKMEE